MKTAFQLIALLAGLSSSVYAQTQAFAPASLANLAFSAVISAGISPYASSGSAIEVFQTGGAFYIISPSGTIASGSGTYSYTQTGPNTGTVQEAFANNYLPNSTYVFTFTSAVGGSFIATQTSTGGLVQAGTFALSPYSSAAPLTNISTRGTLASGQNLNPGFVISGTLPHTVLVRAIGPTLAQYGVNNAIPHTTITVYSGSQAIATNTGWSSSPTQAAVLIQAFLNTGAFTLPTGSNDSAILLTLTPGAYTAIAQGATSSDAGSLLVEVYFVQ